jgi:serine/threonine protein kinase
VGDLVAGRYELLEVLGQGGDSQVVQAIDRHHDRPVALKVRRLPSDEARERLLADAQKLLMQARTIAERIGQGGVLADAADLSERAGA